MNATVAFWIAIVALAAGTLLLRSLPIWLHGKVTLPSLVERLLRHVPAAALTALVVPSALYVKHDAVYSFAPARCVAAAGAFLIAYKSKSTVATLVGGMVLLWIAQAVLGT